ELVDYCIGLPDDVFVSRGWQKLILRLAGEGVLPREIQWRADKVGYAAPLDRWLRSPPFREWMHERLFSGPIQQLPTYDATALRETWTAHQENRVEASWALWRWVSLNEWLTMFGEGAWRPRRAMVASA